MRITERLQEVFCNVFNDDTIQLNDKMTASDIDGWDSVAHINLLLSIEQSFGVQFSSDEIASFNDVGQLRMALKNKGVV